MFGKRNSGSPKSTNLPDGSKKLRLRMMKKVELNMLDLEEDEQQRHSLNSNSSSEETLPTESISFSPYFDDLRENCYWNKAKAESTLLELGDLLENNPNDVYSICIRGTLYQTLGELNKAKDAYKAALDILTATPESMEDGSADQEQLDWINYSLSCVYRKRQIYEPAIECINKIRGSNKLFSAARAFAQAITRNTDNSSSFLNQAIQKGLTEHQAALVRAEIDFALARFPEVVKGVTPLIAKNDKAFYGRHLALRILANLNLHQLSEVVADIKILCDAYPTPENQFLKEILVQRALENLPRSAFSGVRPYIFEVDKQTQLRSDCGKSKDSIFSHTELFQVTKKNEPEYVEDKVTLTNNANATLYYQITLPTSPKFELIVDSPSGKLSKDTSKDLIFKMRLFCTSQLICHIIRISLSHKSPTNKNQRTELGELFLYFIPEGVLSSSLDFDEIVLKEKIAEGGFGTVYKGEWRNSLVAVKVLKTIESFEESEILKREIDIASTLRHSHIVRYYGSTLGITESPSIVMEYIDGGTLATFLENSVSDKFKCKLALDITHGMAFLHSVSIYHRDLKPDNVLVVSFDPDTDCNLKLADFGTSRTHGKAISYYLIGDIDKKNETSSFSSSSQKPNQVQEEETKKEQLSTVTRGIGTLLYQAPESLRGDKNYHLDRADVFSFGVTLWQIFVQRVPYSDEKFKEWRRWHISEFILRGDRLEIPKEIHKDIAKMISNCWAHDPAERPKFSELKEHLARLRNMMPDFKREESSNIGWAGTIDRISAESKLHNCARGVFLVRYSHHISAYVISFVEPFKPDPNSKDRPATFVADGQTLKVSHIGHIKVHPQTGEVEKTNAEKHVLRRAPSLVHYIEELKKEGHLTRPLKVVESQNIYIQTPVKNNYIRSPSDA